MAEQDAKDVETKQTFFGVQTDSKHDDHADLTVVANHTEGSLALTLDGTTTLSGGVKDEWEATCILSARDALRLSVFLRHFAELLSTEKGQK